MKSHKEKAEEMFEMFSGNYTFNGDGNAKECALIAVDLLIEERRESLDDRGIGDEQNQWIKVKEEMQKL